MKQSNVVPPIQFVIVRIPHELKFKKWPVLWYRKTAGENIGEKIWWFIEIFLQRDASSLWLWSQYCSIWNSDQMTIGKTHPTLFFTLPWAKCDPKFIPSATKFVQFRIFWTMNVKNGEILQEKLKIFYLQTCQNLLEYRLKTFESHRVHSKTLLLCLIHIRNYQNLKSQFLKVFLLILASLSSSRSHDPSASRLTNPFSLVDHFQVYRTNSSMQGSPCFSRTHFWQSL